VSKPLSMTWRPSGPNARIVLWTEWPWSLLMAWQGTYLSLYCVSRGALPGQIGAAVGVSGLLQVVGLLAVGRLTDRLGRKAVIQAGDFVGWVCVLGAWVLLPSPLVLLAGLVAQNGTAFVGPAWNSLFTEDAPPSAVPRYFLMLQGMTVLGGLAIPLMAPWVAQAGVKSSGATVLLWSWPLIAAAWLARALWLRESPAGRAQQDEWRRGAHRPWTMRWREGLQGQNGRLAAIRILTQVPAGLMTVFIPLVLVSRGAERLAPSQLALLPLFGSAGLLALWALQRAWHHRSPRQTLTAAAGALAVGLALTAWAPAGSLVTVGMGWGVAMMGQSLVTTVHTPLWLASLSDDARVDVQGWVGAASGLATAAAGPWLGTLLAHDARAVGWALAVAVALALPLTTTIRPLAPRADGARRR
jgi:MFS family permease